MDYLVRTIDFEKGIDAKKFDNFDTALDFYNKVKDDGYNNLITLYVRHGVTNETKVMETRNDPPTLLDFLRSHKNNRINIYINTNNDMVHVMMGSGDELLNYTSPKMDASRIKVMYEDYYICDIQVYCNE